MLNKPIEFVECRETTSFVLEPDAYRFNPNRPVKWLQRLCCWTLRKLHCHNYQREVAFTSHVIHPEKVFDRVLKNHEELLRRNYQEPYMLYIGAKDFAELMEDKEIRNYVQFDVPYLAGSTRRSSHIMGMKIHIIPWMEGLVGVPKRA